MQKKQVLVGLCKSSTISFEKKQELLKKIIGDDKSLISNIGRLRCVAALPDASIKEQVWQEVTNTSSKLSMQEKEAQLGEFAKFNQYEIVKDYNDKFLNNIEQLYKDNSYELFKTFFFAMLPREYEIRQSDIDKLINVKEGHIQKTGQKDD